MIEHSATYQKHKKRRKLLLVLPLLVLPFITLAFWAMGGGCGGGEGASIKKEQDSHTGINSEVPRANVSFRPQDKMSLYKEADQEAEARKQAFRQFNYPLSDDSAQGDGHFLRNVDADPNSRKVDKKLAELQKVLEASSSPGSIGQSYAPAIDPTTYGLQPEERIEKGSGEQLNGLNRLNELIARSGIAGGVEDGEQDKDMQQVNTMLDKILEIQHPEKAAAHLKRLSKEESGRVYPVESPKEEVGVPVLRPVTPFKRFENEVAVEGRTDCSRVLKLDSIGGRVSDLLGDNNEVVGGFYDIDDKDGAKEDNRYTLQAVIAESQTLVSGAAVKMRLMADVVVDGTLIPKGNFVFGTSTVNGERLKIAVSHIRFQNQIFPVHLTVYDLDGMEGIRIPGAIGRDATKEGADRALQSVQMMSLDPSITAQAASAGIEATKGLISKKVKLVRVTVKAGYPVLLQDEQGLQKQGQ